MSSNQESSEGAGDETNSLYVSVQDKFRRGHVARKILSTSAACLMVKLNGDV